MFLEEAGPRQRQLESKWGKMLGGGADALPGVHFKQTDELHHERDVASAKAPSEGSGHVLPTWVRSGSCEGFWCFPCEGTQ